MKTLYLHIGTPKTATTAIQLFCSDNLETLKTHGYYFPDFGLRYPGIRKERNAHFLLGQNRQPWKERNLEEEDQVFRTCFEQIYTIFQDYDNIILTDEGLWNHGFRHQGRCWNSLQKELEKGLFSLKIIVYLRRQDEFLYSWWNQQVKEGAHSQSPLRWEEMVKIISPVQLDYYKVLEKISAITGKEQIIVRQFDRKQFVGETIYADFLDAVGLDFSDEYTISEDLSNISLTKNNNEIKRILNGLPNLDKQSNTLFRGFLTDSSMRPSNDKKYHMFSEEEFRTFMSAYEEGNRQLSQEYLDGRELFSNAYKAEEKWTPQNPEMPEDIITLFGAMTAHLIKENEELKQEIKNNAQQTEMLKQQVERIRHMIKHPFSAVGRKLKNSIR